MEGVCRRGFCACDRWLNVCKRSYRKKLKNTLGLFLRMRK